MPASGVEQQFYVRSQASFDVPEAVVGTDGVGLNSATLTPEQAWEPSAEHVGTASLQTEIEGLRGGQFEATAYVKPAALGTAPDIDPFFIAAGMSSTIVGGTSVTYDLNTTIPSGMQLTRAVGTQLQEVASGLIVGQMDYEHNEKNIPTFKWGGQYGLHGGLLGTPSTDAAGYAAAVSTVNLGAAHAHKIRAGALVQFTATTDNGGAGYLVTAVDSAGTALTISPAIQVGEDIAASITAVTPLNPTLTTAGTIQGGTLGSLTVGGTSVEFISFKMSMQTGLHGNDRAATTNRISRIDRGDRIVSGECEFYFLDEMASDLGDAWNGTTQALVYSVGPTTTDPRMQISIPAARLAVAPIDVDDKNESTFSMAFMARQSAAFDDELSVIFDAG